MKNTIENDITILAVGKTLDLFNVGNRAGVMFELVEDLNLFILSYGSFNMNRLDIESIQNGKMTFKMIRKNNYIILFVKSGKVYQEIVFDPTVYGDNRALRIKDSAIALLGVELNGDIIKAMRTFSLPTKVSAILYECWMKALDEEDYTNNYKEWVRGLQRFAIDELYDQATYLGKLQ